MKKKISTNARLIIEAAYKNGSINAETYNQIRRKYDM